MVLSAIDSSKRNSAGGKQFGVGGAERGDGRKQGSARAVLGWQRNEASDTCGWLTAETIWQPTRSLGDLGGSAVPLRPTVKLHLALAMPLSMRRQGCSQYFACLNFCRSWIQEESGRHHYDRSRSPAQQREVGGLLGLGEHMIVPPGCGRGSRS